MNRFAILIWNVTNLLGCGLYSITGCLSMRIRFMVMLKLACIFCVVDEKVHANKSNSLMCVQFECVWYNKKYNSPNELTHQFVDALWKRVARCADCDAMNVGYVLAFPDVNTKRVRASKWVWRQSYQCSNQKSNAFVHVHTCTLVLNISLCIPYIGSRTMSTM